MALLLTGQMESAAKIVQEVVEAQPDLSVIDSAHLDRLTVLRSRESEAAQLVHSELDQTIAHALAKLNPQQREAWVLSSVYRTALRDVARAMDCSVTATHRHLELAHQSLAESLEGGVDHAAAQLLQLSMSIDLPGYYRARTQRRRAFRRALRIAVVLIVIAVFCAGAVAAWLFAQQIERGSVKSEPPVTSPESTEPSTR